MGEFSKNLQKRLRQKGKLPTKDVEFACRNCLNMFTFAYQDVCLKINGDLEFTPEPECSRCGATEELIFSNYGQEKIEDMLFRNQIRKE